MEVLGDITSEGFLENMRSKGAITASLTASWLMVVPVALSLYCRAREVDMSELIDASVWSPPQS